MNTRKKLKLVQLPVPPPAAMAATGNVPLAAGCLGVATRVHGFSDRVQVDVLPPGVTDGSGDTRLADLLAKDEPDYLGLSLYLWNVDRSLHLAREVKRRSPRTKVLIGGPEVSPDNAWLLAEPAVDVAVSGEGEEALADILQRELNGADLLGVPGVSVRTKTGMSAFGPPRAAKFPLADYPSPYLEGLVPVEAERSAYVEGARGCRSKCTFCFYPKAASGLRVLNPSQVEAVVSGLRDRGATELTFLDPTFNHRPDFEQVLDGLIRANAKRSMSFFAEVRPEGLSQQHVVMLKEAGFDNLEIGLQSVSAKTLKRVKRGGNPAMVAAAAKMMRAEGIDLLVDLIVGLPGDTRDDVMRGVDFLEKHDLGDCAQVFALYVLPGTAMRDTAVEDGLVFEPEPPYRIIRTATMSEQVIHDTLREAEERLGRRLDEKPRPHLVAPTPGSIDVFQLNLDRATAEDRDAAARPGSQHCALWFEGEDLFTRRADLLRAIEARQSVDPYATLDVVLVPSQPFPLDLIALVQGRLDAARPSWATRNLKHRGEVHSQRVSVVLRADFPLDWVEAVRTQAQVFREQSLQQAVRDAARLGTDLPSARIVGSAGHGPEFAQLEDTVDPECVVFADRRLEADWQRRVLGYGDAGQ